MPNNRWLGLVVVAVVSGVIAVPVARAQVALTTSKPELLFAAESPTDPDCGALHALQDPNLPRHVVRLHAEAPGGNTGVSFNWSPPKPEVGTFIADLPLARGDETASIRAMCGEFGNPCILTPDKLQFYHEPDILWIAPSCDTLPENTRRNFPGALVRFAVSAKSGGQRLGKGRASVGYGRLAAITLFVDDMNGIKGANPIPVPLNPFFGAKIDLKGNSIPIASYEFDTGGGDKGDGVPGPCFFRLPKGRVSMTYDSCGTGLLYHSAGKFTALVKALPGDGSAVCDNVAVRIRTCEGGPRIEVKTVPKLSKYVPGDPRKGTVNVRVLLHNDGPTCNFGLVGNVLSCEETIKVGGTTDTKTTNFDLPHCSVTTDQLCSTNADCQCPDCQPQEVCLAQSHCSQTFTQLCQANSGCEKTACPSCKDGETCTQVIELASTTVFVGETAELLNKTVNLLNVFPEQARVVDTWTVNTFNAGSDSTKVKYSIAGRPNVPFTPAQR